MAKTDSKKEIVQLRTQFEKSPRLNLEFRALLSSLFRQHNVAVSDETLRDLVIAHPTEFAATAGKPIDIVQREPLADEKPAATAKAASKTTAAKKK